MSSGAGCSAERLHMHFRSFVLLNAFAEEVTGDEGSTCSAPLEGEPRREDLRGGVVQVR